MSKRATIVLIAALLYGLVGWGTAALARSAAGSAGVKVWRLTAWLSSVVIFVGHILYDRYKLSDSASRTARMAAFSVMIAVFALAIIGPVLAHRNSADFWRSGVLSVLLWPLLTGIPAFIVALAIASLAGRRLARRQE